MNSRNSQKSPENPKSQHSRADRRLSKSSSTMSEKNSHHCHCGLSQHFSKFRAKKLGVFGVILFVGHILFHVVECLILPAVFVGFSRHIHAEESPVPESRIETFEPQLSRLFSNDRRPLGSLLTSYPILNLFLKDSE